MPRPPSNYFKYFPASSALLPWGIGLTAAGFTRIAAGQAYPPPRHPEDHQLDWARGRVLDATQIVLISAGRGTFEARPGGTHAIRAGMAFLLLPKVWHRYRPDPATGWEESWIEIQGPVVDALNQDRVLSASSPVRTEGFGAGLDQTLDAVHARARLTRTVFDPELSALALGVIAAWDRSARDGPRESRVAKAIAKAERYLVDHCREPVNIEALAREVGIAYSHFRRLFKEQTGYSPWQYVVRLRLGFARRILSSSEATLDDAAAQLGFGSGFHLSRTFKQTYGISPAQWRRELKLGE